MAWRFSLVLCAVLGCFWPAVGAEKIPVLIVDGQNNHAVWPKTTQMMKRFLEETGLFTVDVQTTAPKGTDPAFLPKFANYRVVLSNYNGEPWPEATQQAFEEFVRNGGGFVVVHAADNSFPQWPEYNQMIGLGGWYGRTEKHGPYVYLDGQGKEIRDTTPGDGGHHGQQHEFNVVVRDSSHPVTRGMPREWKHTKDELYDKLRGPAGKMKILATAYADPATGGSGRHEPMIFTIEYGKGRVFHTPMGHAEYSQACIGFVTTIQRGTEWAATGNVTQAIPKDFPTAEQSSSRSE